MPDDLGNIEDRVKARLEAQPTILEQFASHMKEAMPKNPFPTAILDEQNNVVPVHIADALIWQMEHVSRIRVDLTKVGNIEISTVFSTVALSGTLHDHEERESFHFETMIFGPESAYVWNRYQTMEEAKNGHAAAVESILAKIE